MEVHRLVKNGERFPRGLIGRTSQGGAELNLGNADACVAVRAQGRVEVFVLQRHVAGVEADAEMAAEQLFRVERDSS